MTILQSDLSIYDDNALGSADSTHSSSIASVGTYLGTDEHRTRVAEREDVMEQQQQQQQLAVHSRSSE